MGRGRKNSRGIGGQKAYAENWPRFYKKREEKKERGWEQWRRKGDWEKKIYSCPGVNLGGEALRGQMVTEKKPEKESARWRRVRKGFLGRGEKKEKYRRGVKRRPSGGVVVDKREPKEGGWGKVHVHTLKNTWAFRLFMGGMTDPANDEVELMAGIWEEKGERTGKEGKRQKLLEQSKGIVEPIPCRGGGGQFGIWGGCGNKKRRTR